MRLRVQAPPDETTVNPSPIHYDTSPNGNQFRADVTFGSGKAQGGERFDEARLERFLRSVRAGALTFATMRVWDEETALDLLQEAMIGFVPVARRHEEEAWKRLFYTILGRRIADWQRKQIWRERIARIIPFAASEEDEAGGPVLAHSAADQDHEPERQHGAMQLSQRFEKALAELPPRQQEAYLLRQWQQFSVQETARIMKCSEGSVKTHLSRAMAALREQLGEWIDE